MIDLAREVSIGLICTVMRCSEAFLGSCPTKYLVHGFASKLQQVSMKHVHHDLPAPDLHLSRHGVVPDVL